MIYWVIYDISKNSSRKKVSDICKDYGLERIQKSAFLGELTKNKAEMMAIQIKKSIAKDDKVFIFPYGKEDYQKKIVLGQLNERMVNNPDVIFLN